MSTVCIVQARMGSTRLPGKSVMSLARKPMIWHILNRLKQAETIDYVVLAIPKEIDNDTLIESALSLGLVTFEVKGDPNDLLGRYAKAAIRTDADTIVRVPGDNPCIDPDEVDRIVEIYEKNARQVHCLITNLDQNVLGNGYPGGLGAEVYDPRFLFWLDRNIDDTRQREHPHLWAFENKRVMTCACPQEFRRPDLRFDVNTISDFEFIADIYNHFKDHIFDSKELIDYIDTKDDQHRSMN